MPRSGFWIDPDRAGSSLTLENQNGTWAGVYYGYDAEGKATWYLFSGVPERAEQGTAYWTLSAELLQFQNGNDIDSDAQAPEQTGSRGTLQLTVVQRNLIRYSVDGGATHTLQPFVWGTPMQALLPQAPQARLPMITSPEPEGPIGTPWVVTVRGEGLPDYEPMQALWTMFWLSPWSPSWSASADSYYSSLSERWADMMSPPPPGVRMMCGVAEDWRPTLPQDLRTQLGDTPMCIFQAESLELRGTYFIAQLGDVGDDYFFAVAADGRTVLEGTRLLYR